jgi:glycosyltransferase involved in cell wall biosynthesis
MYCEEKMKIIVFSKYLAFMVGGAEKSMFELLKRENQNNVELLSFNNTNAFLAQDKKHQLPEEWKLSFINPFFSFKRFFYLEYLLNRRKIYQYFQLVDNQSILYSYSIYAPIAINSFEGKTKFFIRSESDLAINPNYYSGIRKLIKWIYVFVEYPAFFIYKRDLKKAIEKSEVISNSNFMSKKLMELYNKKSSVLYPFIDEERLKNDFSKFGNIIKNKGVVFIGDSPIKGLEIAKEIASLMPTTNFYFFSRFIDSSKKINNITWMVWEKNEVDIYKYAKVVIVPSICEEGYGRVSREAFLLNIPVLVSNRGGLPETVDGKHSCIVNGYLNPQIWKEKIENFL